MDTRQVQYFLTVCAEKSLSRAAERLYLTQQGLSKAIHQLERELNVQLFYRSNTGVRLTPYGEVFLKHAQPFLRHQDYMLTALQAAREQLEHELSIGYATGAFDLLPPDFLSDFLIAHPNLSLKMTSYPDDQCAKAILDDQLQLGFLPGPIEPGQLSPLYTFRNPLCLMVGPTHPLYRHERVSLPDLTGHNVVSLNTAVGSQDVLRTACAQAGVAIQLRLAAAETRLMAELCARGCAVCFYAGRTDLFPDDVRALPVDGLHFTFEFHFVANQHVYRTELSRAFIRYALNRWASVSAASGNRTPPDAP